MMLNVSEFGVHAVLIGHSGTETLECLLASLYAQGISIKTRDFLSLITKVIHDRH